MGGKGSVGRPLAVLIDRGSKVFQQSHCSIQLMRLLVVSSSVERRMRRVWKSSFWNCVEENMNVHTVMSASSRCPAREAINGLFSWIEEHHHEVVNQRRSSHG